MSSHAALSPPEQLSPAALGLTPVRPLNTNANAATPSLGSGAPGLAIETSFTMSTVTSPARVVCNSLDLDTPAAAGAQSGSSRGGGGATGNPLQSGGGRGSRRRFSSSNSSSFSTPLMGPQPPSHAIARRLSVGDAATATAQPSSSMSAPLPTSPEASWNMATACPSTAQSIERDGADQPATPLAQVKAPAALMAAATTEPRRASTTEDNAELGRGAFAVVRTQPHPRKPGKFVAVKTVSEGHNAPERAEAAKVEVAFARRFVSAWEAAAASTTDGGMESANVSANSAEGSSELLHRSGVESDLRGVVKIYEVYRDTVAGHTTVTMELAAGGSADRRAGEFRVAGAPDAAAARAALRKLTRLARDCLRALRAMHGVMRVLHRDIKPANVLLRADGSACLCDFGCCAVLPEGGGDSATDQQGSVLYMAPERLRGEAHSFASDVWALGVTILQLALGDHPFYASEAHPSPAGPSRAPSDSGESGRGSPRDKFWTVATKLRVSEGSEACAAAVAAAVDDALKRCVAGFPVGSGGDEALCSFLRECLAANAEQRPSPTALLAHPFIAACRADSA